MEQTAGQKLMPKPEVSDLFPGARWDAGRAEKHGEIDSLTGQAGEERNPVGENEIVDYDNARRGIREGMRDFHVDQSFTGLPLVRAMEA